MLKANKCRLLYSVRGRSDAWLKVKISLEALLSTLLFVHLNMGLSLKKMSLSIKQFIFLAAENLF